MTLLNVTNLVIQSSYRDNEAFINWLHQSVISTLFDCYIIANVSSTIMWEALQEKVSKWIHWKPFINLWTVRSIPAMFSPHLSVFSEQNNQFDSKLC